MLKLSVLLLAVVAGCSPAAQDDSKLYGIWNGKFVTVDGKQNPGADLTLNPDHHFRELYKNLEILGKWRASGKSVTLTVEMIGGKSVADAKKIAFKLAKDQNSAVLQTQAENMDKDVTIMLSDDGKQLVAAADADAGGHAVFTKQ